VAADRRFAWLLPVAEQLDAARQRIVGLSVENELLHSRIRRPEASYAFIEQPQTNAVAERFCFFFKTLKDQIVRSRAYDTVAEVRAAVGTFVALHSDQWLPEKNGFLSSSAASAPRHARQAQGVAAQDRLVSR